MRNSTQIAIDLNAGALKILKVWKQLDVSKNKPGQIGKFEGVSCELESSTRLHARI